MQGEASRRSSGVRGYRWRQRRQAAVASAGALLRQRAASAVSMGAETAHKQHSLDERCRRGFSASRGWLQRAVFGVQQVAGARTKLPGMAHECAPSFFLARQNFADVA